MFDTSGKRIHDPGGTARQIADQFIRDHRADMTPGEVRLGNDLMTGDEAPDPSCPS